jgi:uncharacterized membrane protein YpjA
MYFCIKNKYFEIFLLILAIINIFAAIFSIKYYLSQLLVTNSLFWFFVPDSIIATFFFAIALILFSKKILPESLGAFAIIGMLKYGTWSIFVLFLGGNNFLDYWYFYLGHFLMIIETMIFFKKFRINVWHLLPALILFLINDVLDYFFGLHPPFNELYFTETMVFSFILTIACSILVLFVYSKDK